jgi:hypothetical protein
MSEGVSRRVALSLLGAALSVALAGLTEDQAEAATAGTKPRHERRVARNQQGAAGPAPAPAEASASEPLKCPPNADALRRPGVGCSQLGQ